MCRLSDETGSKYLTYAQRKPASYPGKSNDNGQMGECWAVRPDGGPEIALANRERAFAPTQAKGHAGVTPCGLLRDCPPWPSDFPLVHSVGMTEFVAACWHLPQSPKAVEPNHATAHMFLGAVLMQTLRGDKGIAECEQALMLDRNLADAHGFIGLGKYLTGRGEEVEAHIQEALRLSPRDTRIFIWSMFVGMSKLTTGADLEAIKWFSRSLEANRNHALTHFHFAATLALLGSMQEARSAAQEGIALDPSFTIRRYRVHKRSDDPTYLAKRERFCEGMRLAGLPRG